MKLVLSTHIPPTQSAELFLTTRLNVPAFPSIAKYPFHQRLGWGPCEHISPQLWISENEFEDWSWESSTCLKTGTLLNSRGTYAERGLTPRQKEYLDRLNTYRDKRSLWEQNSPDFAARALGPYRVVFSTEPLFYPPLPHNKSETPTRHGLTLPSELAFLMVNYLDPWSLLQLRCVSHWWKSIAGKDTVLASSIVDNVISCHGSDVLETQVALMIGDSNRGFLCRMIPEIWKGLAHAIMLRLAVLVWGPSPTQGWMGAAGKPIRTGLRLRGIEGDQNLKRFRDSFSGWALVVYLENNMLKYRLEFDEFLERNGFIVDDFNWIEDSWF